MSPDFKAISEWIFRRDDEALKFNAVEAQNMLADVQALVADFAVLERTLTAKVNAVLPERGGTYTLIDQGTGEAAIVKKRSKAKKYEYDDAGLLARVIAKGFDDRQRDDDGIPTEREGDAIARVLGLVYPLAARVARTGALKKLGLDLNDYRDEQRADVPVVTAQSTAA